ncbi:TAT-variant-translocated molybdopterin oxidoreductase [Polyangium aurulentum]|uniref:TAT-variant-translocated molybdopterin oxidoreductase n=1 Tax=Polyangium aurulentum TaxID=2567896 RepID=UPI0010AE4CCC|nr:TAT-variant-translocated molybdopterin oxidoreductase [Polyangium aurulentum]UQA54570.1 TAT-variant-translocated molybdopterin oxidoreductase [Polyangium aurulentum]
MGDARAVWEKALAGKTGREYWRSIEELVHRGELGEDGEFPEGADVRPDDVSRRSFFKLIGASMALAGIAGCVKDPVEKILPYTFRPAEVVPGIPRFYATSMTLDGYATGLLVATREGRPIKVEGNPAHPASLGATGVFEQASILGLYDPARARSILRQGAPGAWESLAAELGRPRTDGGAGLRLLLEPTGSPLVSGQLDAVVRALPAARIVFHSPALSHGAEEGAALVFGRRLLPQYDFKAASVVVSLDADFLDAMPMSVRYARHFAERRRPAWPNPAMSRLYVIECMPTPTGSVADHRFRRRSSDIGVFAAALAAELVFGEGATLPPGLSADALAGLRPFLAREDRRVISAIARDLRRAGPAGLVVVGDRQPPSVHALGYLINAALGALGTTIWTTEPVHYDAGGAAQDLAGLVGDMRAGRVDTLVILESNPVYTAPADLDFEEALRSVPRSFHLGLHADETGTRTTWFVPAAHYLEAWGDARAYDGTASIVQPLIRPLFGGRTPAEILALMLGNPFPSAHALVREHWRARSSAIDFEGFWEAALRSGVVDGTAAPRTNDAISCAGIGAIAAALAATPASPPELYEVNFYPDHRVHDGRFAHNPWLQELPDPLTKMVWGNAALMSVQTAAALGVRDEDVIELELVTSSPPPGPAVAPPLPPGPKVRAPACVVPGHADHAISLRLGHGRRAGGGVAEGVGFDAYRLRTTPGLQWAARLAARPTGTVLPLALTQMHWSMHDRPLVLSATLEEYRDNPHFTRPHKGPVLSVLPPVEYQGEQWAMSIDTSICTGCSACVVACQAENNIPVVGKEEVQKSREMHWLRIDTYYEGPPEAPEVVHQPMLCQHCEKAPCEYVCPVNATVHSPDGLNEMVYNRCIGTRFCSNNCPYKVRRFNWFDYAEERPDMNAELRKLQKNPDVTVRERGVMEKCTFCVQRIRAAEIKSRIDQRSIQPGEVNTACAQACPTRAIQFGSLAHRNTTMVAWREEPRSYGVLHELGTRPRVSYLATIRNPNPELG